MNKNKQIGLALGSGGLRGLAHIGIIKVLKRNNIPISIIGGSSAGSLIGSYYALNGEVDTLEDYLVNNGEEIIPLFFDFSLKGGFIKGSRLKKYLEKTFKKCEFKDSKIPFISVATDLVTGQRVVIKSGPLTPAVMGSMSIPILFKPVKIKDHLLVDGALSDPVPVNELKTSSESKVIAVNLYHVNEFKDRKFTMAAIVGRSTRIALHNLAKESVKSADIVLNPDTSTLLNNTSVRDYFKPETVKALIAIGEKEATKHLKKIKELTE